MNIKDLKQKETGTKRKAKAEPVKEVVHISNGKKTKLINDLPVEEEIKNKNPILLEEEDAISAKRIAKATASKRYLPTCIMPINNADKAWHEAWNPSRDLLNIPHPFRAVLLGPPNSGKTTTVKNILMRADPPFTKMVVIYPDGGGFTDEYADCGELTMLGYIPPPEDWDGKEKTLCVIDDFELKSLSKQQKSNLDRLVGHVSTHRNVSVCVCSQDPYNTPPIVRRCSNLLILWKLRDIVSLQSFASRTGIDISKIFRRYNSKNDSIWIDLTSNSPAPLRINGYQLIEQ